MVEEPKRFYSEKEMLTMTQGQEEEARGSKCQDCGNQAKKDCSYSRCRTCCKNKGFECQTHIKSTWIPVDRRQQREKQPSPATDHRHHFLGDIPKKHKQTTYSALEEFKLPAATNSTAIFRCVQVRSMDDAVNEIAYQTSVNIGGHVFSGLLYDQGPEQSFYARGTDSTSTSTIDPQQNLQSLINASTQTRDGATMTPLLSALSAAHDEPFLSTPSYPFPFAPFRPGPAMPYSLQSKP